MPTTPSGQIRRLISHPSGSETFSGTLTFVQEFPNALNVCRDKNTLIFNKEEKSLWILPENPNCFVHHLGQGGICLAIAFQLILTVFGLEETCIKRDRSRQATK